MQCVHVRQLTMDAGSGRMSGMALRVGNKMMYIGVHELTWWERAERRAKEQGLSLSKYVARLLRSDDMSRQLSKPKTLNDLRQELHRLREEAVTVEQEIMTRLEAGEKLESVS
jgi:hypothetical protein